jgi:Amt family ammonium transporter
MTGFAIARKGALSCVAMLMAATPALAQAAAQPAKIDAADTAWMISATGLVLMMSIPGLALFYSGMVRKKNVLATMAQTLAAVALGSILWMMAGYSLTFTGEGPVIGTFERLFLNGMDLNAISPFAKTIPESVFMLYQMTFAVITVALVAGSVADRMRFSACLVCRRLVDAGLCADRALGVGRRIPRHRRRAGFRRRLGGAFERRHCRPGRLLSVGLAARLRHRQSRAL